MEKIYKNLQVYRIPLILLFTLFSLIAPAQYRPQDSILFESGSTSVRIDTSLPTNIWQIGIPQKPFLNVAWSQPQGIITETVVPYPPNTESIFYFTIDSSSLHQDYATYLSFMNKYDTDTLVDRGTIEVSYTGGGVWCPLGNWSWTCPDGPALLVWDQDSSATTHRKHEHLEVTSGHSDGWLFSRCHFYWMVFDEGSKTTIPDSVMIRFKFNSDGTDTGKDGWIIDNIIFGKEDYQLGISENSSDPSSLSVFPNPVVGESVIRSAKPFSTPATISILDRSGKILLKQNEVKAENFKINRKNFIPGLYFIKITDHQGKTQLARFIVQ